MHRLCGRRYNQMLRTQWSIGSRAFKNLRIKKLVLDNNRIKSIQKDAFRGLESVLQELYINNNKLSEVPMAAIQGLRALNVLSLRCNKIGNLTDAVFLDTPSLIEVNLGCNKICKIDENAFGEVKNTLQNLILDNNCLKRIPSKAIDGMQFLIALHIKYNEIEKLGSNDLRNMTSLSMLTLTGNAISHISKNFTHNTPNLRYIYLGENALSSIEAGTMKQFSQAEIIDLSYNNLPEITVDLFNGMENLQHLNLEANAIKDVAPGAFATTPLLLLWLPHNCLTSVSPNMFQGTPFLKQVSIAYNNIRNVQAFSFAHLANLHTLDLSNNKLQSIQPSAIMGSDFLTVRVQENPLVCSQDGFHVMNGREAINLTTEANLICQTDYIHDVTDKCPRRLDRPIRQPCCSNGQKNQPSTSTTEIPSSSTMTSSSIASSSLMPLSSMSSSEQPTTSPTPSSTTEQPTSPAVTESRAAMRARKLNMERFWRLQRRPADMAGMVAHIKSANPVDSVVPVGGVDVGTVTNISAGVSKSKEVMPPSEEMNQISGPEKPLVSGPSSTILDKMVYEKVKDNSGAVNSASVGEFNQDQMSQTIHKKEEQQVVMARRS
ncbi:leucine rich repeat domain-containing protein [Ditylenchus destructor]|uniref:Leucine rich repeat domain-containing protein n=1 Tax=Ditylenchus destructor TaxID=166010 RepID=A0AAD4NG62_9BILA|nr:leucine rich repeat domain-containing protein [Ditylenchus destructor]